MTPPTAILGGFTVALLIGAAGNGYLSSSPVAAEVAAGVSTIGVGDGANQSGLEGTDPYCVRGSTGQPNTGAIRDTPERRGLLIDAIIAVESGGDPNAVGDGGLAVGCLQIWPVVVEDCNRILGREEFTLADRLDRGRSVEMFRVYTNHYSSGCSDEVIARRWNGGPRGDRKAATAGYWLKVQKEMEAKRGE